MRSTLARVLAGLFAGLTTFLVAKGLPPENAQEVTMGLVSSAGALTYGIGVGAAFALWELGSQPGPVSKKPVGVHFDFGVRYMLGAEAEYLKEGSIQVVGDQVTYLPEQSKTDMIHPHFRIRVSF